MKKTAVILGASGLTGRFLLEKLLVDDRYERLKLFSRKPLQLTNPKVFEKTGNLLELEKFSTDFTGDEVYCCIGTTTKKTPDKRLYRSIDFGIPAAAAKLAKQNKIPSFLVVSAMGADSRSRIFYNKTKGDMEAAVLAEEIQNTFIFRPSLIGGKREESRFLERIGLVVFEIVQPLFLGKFKKYKIIEAESIAQAMINLANNKPTDKQIIQSDAILNIAKNQD